MFTEKPSKVSAIHPDSIIAITFTISLFSSGAVKNIKYAKSKHARAIIPPTSKVKFIPDLLLNCLFIPATLLLGKTQIY